MTDDEIIVVLRQQFERVLPFLQPAIDRSFGSFFAEHVWEDIENQKAQLFTAAKSAMVTKIELHRSGKLELFIWLAGGLMDEVLKLEKQAIAFGKKRGCTLACVNGRDGWLRAADGYQKVTTVMMKEI